MKCPFKAEHTFQQFFLIIILTIVQLSKMLLLKGKLYSTVTSLVKCKTVLLKVYSISCNESVVVLQNSMDLLNAVPGSDTEMCYDGNQVIDIKAEDVTDIQEDEHPVQIACPVIKTEQEVRLCVHRQITQMPAVFLFSI
jgi:hypothetical protein